MTVKVPCNVLRACLKWIDDRCASPHLADAAMVPIVSSFALHMMSIKDPTRVRRLEDICLDLITVMLDARRSGLEGAEQSAAVGEIVRAGLYDYLRRNFANPHITVDAAARASYRRRFGVSPRETRAATVLDEELITRVTTPNYPCRPYR